MIINPQTGAVLFSVSEMASRDGTVRLAEGFADKLLELRLRFGRPMIPTSFCRTPEHNRSVNGEDRSFHLTEGNPLCPTGTCAIDVAVRDNVYRDALVRLAYELGWSVGHYDDFVHFDRRVDHGNALMSWWGRP